MDIYKYLIDRPTYHLTFRQTHFTELLVQQCLQQCHLQKSLLRHRKPIENQINIIIRLQNTIHFLAGNLCTNQINLKKKKAVFVFYFCALCYEIKTTTTKFLSDLHFIMEATFIDEYLLSRDVLLLRLNMSSTDDVTSISQHHVYEF